MKTKLKWSVEKQVTTKFGDKLVKEAKPTSEFWSEWSANKQQLKNEGITVNQNKDKSYKVVCWSDLSNKQKKQKQETIEASRASDAKLEIPKPEGLEYFPFQKAGIAYAVKRNKVLIADEMGLGKTIQAIGVINYKQFKKILIVCPKSLMLNWKKELETWLVNKELTIGLATSTDFPIADIVIINYDIVKKCMPALKGEWELIIEDEAHYIKNAKAQRSIATKSLKSKNIIRMTGTPICNKPIDLYNLVNDLDDKFKNFWAFAKRYCNAYQGPFGWDLTGASNLEEMQEKLRSTIMVRRLKSEVLTDLPAKTRQVIFVEEKLTAQEKAVIDFESIDNLSDLGFSFEELSKIRKQTAIKKIPYVINHIESLMEENPEQKIVIMAHHHEVINALYSALNKYRAVVVTGETKPAERDINVFDFQNNPNVKLFIGSITAAGVGITLTASSTVVFAELDWVPGNVSQAEDRCHRIGQNNNVLIQHIVIENSIDANLINKIIEKQEVIEKAVNKNVAPEYAEIKKIEIKEEKQKEKAIKKEIENKAYSTEDMEVLRKKLAYIAKFDGDRAIELNGIGFNKVDTDFGHSLAKGIYTQKQAIWAAKLVHKYRKQLENYKD